MVQGHPIVVVGAGPVGLAAAAELNAQGLPFVVLERGVEAGAAVAEWGHVRLFSMWRDLVDPAAEKLLVPRGWQRPSDDGYPTGAQWRDSYLVHLAEALGDRVRFGVEVTGVSRRGRDRVVDAGRDEQPFVVALRTDAGEERLLARAVIDASGTWTSPNPIGGNGLVALGESRAADRIAYRIPDLTDPAVRARHAGRTTAVVGRGHSALTVLVALAELAKDVPETRVLWVLRRDVGDAFGGGADDQLAARGALGTTAQRAVEAGEIEVVTGFHTAEVRAGSDERLVLVSEDARELTSVDEVVAVTGFRPDLSFLSEVRLALDTSLQAPVDLAPLIDPNVHSCGTVYPHGAAELSHPDADFYLVGMKSYGRAPTFLALTGYEQVRSVAAALAGDHESAARVELTLPETGVCNGSGGVTDMAADAGGACGPADATDVADETGGCCGSAAAQDAVAEQGDCGARQPALVIDDRIATP
ncbi:NAD(P)-binding domain-containing protein [Spiractinospora alimapuensis]|uniref:NAD(P)-binding domain-containing protein n=1 Tax=Spiractinospora alimapuensis TaxID=2820884 RepID=UPI001F16CA3C|nr:NAD(P)-binding domain-containing protein [Spiractinospora alimapuensis]QVQ52241.1 NAD(P)-binding domain-containing protein [Spiractinospora alimapuensis]